MDLYPWFDSSQIDVLIFVIILSGLILYFIRRAKKNPDSVYIRRISGLDRIEEAIGRATELGKPLLYLNGLKEMSAVSTIAATNILGQVTKKIALYSSEIKVPCYDPVVMSVAQETVHQAYLEAGRPDAFRKHNIFFISNDQFAYAAAVDGIILREQPAAILYMGYYYAESLLLAETGVMSNAIQIAGTDAITQLPFFIVTCDATLMGEELYAASAYLSKEPSQLGSLKGQDAGKLIILVIILIGSILSTLGIMWLTDIFSKA